MLRGEDILIPTETHSIQHLQYLRGREGAREGGREGGRKEGESRGREDSC